MGSWWNEWRIWAMTFYRKLPDVGSRMAFIRDVMNVAGTAFAALGDMPDPSNAWKRPMKLIRWGIKNPDPLAAARAQAVAVRNEWERRTGIAPTEG